MPKVALVIRTKNEERWIGRCLRMVDQQTFRDVEVIIVDDQSSDHTLDIAKKFSVRTLQIEDFTPGKAINLGIRATDAHLIGILSAHCIPRDEHWLQSLLENMGRQDIAGVYGRQLPFAYSSALNKRDLWITFGLDHRIQVKDSFFHNANSMIRRSVWDRIPFDETVSNIEDRAWGKTVIEAGYKIAYEPEAAVYHYHVIHQDQNEGRARNIVRIMERLDSSPEEGIPKGFHPETMNIVGILPVLGPPLVLANSNLLQRCLDQLRLGPYVEKVVVIAEHPEAISIARNAGATVVERPSRLTKLGVTVEEVIQYALRQIESGNDYFDAVLYVNYLYPFRPPQLFEHVIEEFARTGVDTVFPTLKDYQAYWIERGGRISRVDSGFTPRELKTPVQKGMIGLGCISSSEFVRKACLIGDNITLIPFEDALYSMKANEAFARKVIEVVLRRDSGFATQQQ